MDCEKGMTKYNLFALARWATDELNKCMFWQCHRKKILTQIIFECYKDIRSI